MLTLIIAGMSADVDLSLCDNGSWCLGANDTGRQCCQQNRGLFILDGVATTESPNVASASPSAGITSATSAGSTSTAASVGIGLGVGLGIIALIASVVCIVVRRRRRTADHDIGMPGSRRKSLQYNSEYISSPEPRSAAMASLELDSRIATNVPNRHSDLSYRAFGFQDGPAELPCEGYLPGEGRPGFA